MPLHRTVIPTYHTEQTSKAAFVICENWTATASSTYIGAASGSKLSA